MWKDTRGWEFYVVEKEDAGNYVGMQKNDGLKKDGTRQGAPRKIKNFPAFKNRQKAEAYLAEMAKEKGWNKNE
jgi:hypothetical protein